MFLAGLGLSIGGQSKHLIICANSAMKVLDLECSHQHRFEGWFASEHDFVTQCQKLQLECPVCGDPAVTKKLSAPRLHLSTSHSGSRDRPELTAEISDVTAPTDPWFAVVRQVLASTTDVGEKFAEEVRKMHYGEIKARGIRGTATLQEAQSLMEEGIDVTPLPIPVAMKKPLQ